MELEFMSDAEVGDSELFIYFDAEGLDTLKRAIGNAIATGHEHLMAKSWGGNEITISSDGGSTSYKKVTLTFVRN